MTQPDRLWTASTVGLLAASTLAAFGAWIDFLVILAMAAYAYQADGFTMAGVSALILLPALVLGQRLGRWLDRTDPGRAIAGGLLLRAATTAMLMTQPSLPMFCLWVLLRSAFTVVVDPAFNVIVGRLVPQALVPNCFGAIGLMRNVSKIAAPVIGTSIASQSGDAAALGLSVAMTVAALLIALPAAARTRPAAPSPVPIAESSAPEPPPLDAALLSRFLATVTVFAFVVFFVNHQLPVLLRNAGFDKALLGALVSCSGAGGILAAMVMTRSRAAARARDPMAATTVAVFAVSSCFVVLGAVFLLPASIAPFAAGVVFFCTGAFASIEAIRSNTVIVQNFAGHVGAVSGTVQSSSSAAMLVSPWIAALVIPSLTLPVLLMTDGLVGIGMLTLVLLRFRGAAAARRVAAAPDVS